MNIGLSGLRQAGLSANRANQPHLYYHDIFFEMQVTILQASQANGIYLIIRLARTSGKPITITYKELTMQWENLTSYDFAAAVQTTQRVAILPVGVLEAHSAHLPLGMDMFHAHYTACRAAEIEPAIVFPAYPYSMNVESSHLPGAFVVQRELAFQLIETVCDEMYRNGIDKIILHNGHGGNRFFLPLFVMTLPEKRKPYVVYYANLPHFPGSENVAEGKELGHACEVETSVMMKIDGSLVKMGQLPRPFHNLERGKVLQEAGAYTQADWYAMYPAMYVGDAAPASPEKGKILLDGEISMLVDLIKLVKADTVTPALVKEFNQRADHPAVPDAWLKG